MNMDMQQPIWAAGDFSLIGGAALIVGEMLCEAVDLRAGERVLDVAAGSGNTTLAAARRGCDAQGIDFVPALMQRAMERAAVERLEIRMSEGNAEQLAFDTASFDAVLSTFGVIFATDAERAAAEMARVCRPGGRIGLTAWTPEGASGQLFAILDRHLPGRDLVASVEWGMEPVVRERLRPYCSEIVVQRKKFKFRSRSVERWLEGMRRWFGPARTTFDALDASGQEACAKELVAMLERFNESGDERVHAPAEYLEVVAIRNGG